MALPLCPATNRRGEPCELAAGHSTIHPGYGLCKWHGGSAPGGIVQAEKLKLRETADRMAVPADVDPSEGLLELARIAYGMQAWYGMLVADLERGELYGPVGGAQGAHPSYEAHVLLRMHAEERDRAAKTLKMCIDAGVQERQVRVAEQTGQLLAARFRLFAQLLGVDMADPVVQEKVRRALTEPIETTGRDLG